MKQSLARVDEKMILSFIFLQALRICCAQEEPISVLRHKLSRNLFEGYHKEYLPRLNESEPVKVQFIFELINIKEVNAKEQAITVYGWVRQTWYNPFLKWNASDYGGVETIYVSAETVWVPDILMYNNVDAQDRMGGGVSTYKTNVLISSSGENYWTSPAIFKTVCAIDVTYFPFDMQTCTLKFGSWALNSGQVVMCPAGNDTGKSEKYVDNGEWELVKVTSKRNVVLYGDVEFDDVTVTVVIGREYFNVFVNLIIPCMLISTMIFLGFILPPECGERIGLSITVLLAMTVFQQLTSSIFPSFDFPLLGQYYFATSVEISISLVATTVVLNFAARKNTKMPRWLKTVLLEWTARVVCLRKSVERSCPKPKRKRSVRDKRSTESRANSFGRERLTECSANSLIRGANQNGHVSHYTEDEDSDGKPRRKEDRLVNELQNVFVISKHFDYGGLRYANAIKSHELNNQTSGVEQSFFEAPESDETLSDGTVPHTGVLDENGEELDENELALRHWEWIIAARILDRALLWVSIIAGLVTFFAIFMRAPRLKEIIFGL